MLFIEKPPTMQQKLRPSLPSKQASTDKATDSSMSCDTLAFSVYLPHSQTFSLKFLHLSEEKCNFA